MPSKRSRRILIAGGVIAYYAAGTAYAVNRGYTFGRNVTVRCRDGHLFSTIWLPGVSVKSVRLGFWRVQWCPAGRHVSLVRLVKPADLTEAERAFAAEHHDTPIP